ncbi:MAG: hypothetical protein IJW73_08210 [Candidatus Gastranaerophilales bacterium]|nr:hypothetical protein [Candidatus Gastranaerophilales bacterium]
MQQIQGLSVENLPKTGYLVSTEEKKEKYYKNESHIHKQTLLSGLKADAHKLHNDIFTYFPKGFAGSKNSDFYEYLSLGMVPYLIGSGMLIGLYSGAKSLFNLADGCAAGKVANKMAAGVVLYGVGKWAYQRLARAGIKASTGIDLDMRYTNKKNELPEPGQEKGLVRVQYPGVYDSVQFYRSDLLAKDAELNHNDVYYHDDKIIKKAGFKNKLHAPNQTSSDKIRKVKARTTAMENIGKYVIAATGVALGSQEAFENIKWTKPRTILTALKNGAIELWHGGKDFVPNEIACKIYSNITKGAENSIPNSALKKHFGKGLIIASGVATLLTWLVPTLGFKHNPNTVKTKVDTNKEYEVC